MNNITTSDSETTRRDFLKTSSTAAVASAATLSLISRSSAYGQNSDTIRVGLVGCGGRGTGAANQALSADDNVKLTAVADVFPDKVDRAVNGLKKRHEKKVDVPHQFVGLDAYQKLIDSGVDLVVLATPPGFRPLHFRAVVEAGKHCFIEKPMATDAPGVRSIMESVKISKQKKARQRQNSAKSKRRRDVQQVGPSGSNRVTRGPKGSKRGPRGPQGGTRGGQKALSGGGEGFPEGP